MTDWHMLVGRGKERLHRKVGGSHRGVRRSRTVGNNCFRDRIARYQAEGEDQGLNVHI